MPGLFDPTRKKQKLPPTNYYVFRAGFVDGQARISKQPDLPPRLDNWMTGQLLGSEIEEPLHYEIWKDDQGIMIPFYYELGAPLMSIQLVAVLQNAGVDNLQTFAAVVTETDTGTVYHDYRAVNVVGLVDALDRDQSEYEGLGLTDEPENDAVFFKKMVLDESRCHNLPMFRLAKSYKLVVHARVKDAIEAAGPWPEDSLRFTHPLRVRG